MLLDRSWLVDDEYEGERELAAFDGMNLFAAAAMLSQVNIQSLVDEMTPQERVEYFAEMVGLSRVLRFNEIIEVRMRALLSSETLDQASNVVENVDTLMEEDDFGMDGSPYE
ncbi:hypothetical protein FRC03_010197 [Tulasnella sp. 419]|nr:hypothetical protein FRC03_010197 [Tulasnella sp. 419]